MLVNGKNKALEKSIRQKKAPLWENIFEQYAITFKEFIERLRVDDLVERENLNLLSNQLEIEESNQINFFDVEIYVEIIKKILLDKESYHIFNKLSKEELFFIQVFITTITRVGFRFIDIEYLTLNAIRAKKASNWVKKIYKKNTFLQKDLIIGIYPKEALKRDTASIKTENEIFDLIESIFSVRIVFFENNIKKTNIKPIHFHNIKLVPFLNRIK